MKSRWDTRLTKLMEFVMAMLLAAMAIIVFINVILRYVFSSGINGTEDIARLMFIWLCFLGAVAVMARHEHLTVDILVSRLPPRARRAVAIVAHVLMIFALGMLLYGSWGQMLLNHGTMAMGAVAYPLSWGYAAGVFAGAGCLIYIMRSLMRQLRKGPQP